MLKTRRPVQEHESGIGIKLDYSNTYFDNEILDSELESKLAQIGRERYRVRVERNETLKEARKVAENMQQLSDAIKKGAIGDSVSIFSGGKVGKHVDEKDKISDKSSEASVDNLCNEVNRINTNGNQQDSGTTSEARGSDTDSDKPRRAMNTLTMFALSMQKFSSPIRHRNPIQTPNEPRTKQENTPARSSHPQKRHAHSAFARAPTQRAFSRLDRRPKSQRPVTFRQRRVKDGEVLEAVDVMPVMVYEINLHKRKQTRSRRELQEMSKMEQKEHSLKVDREEERKQKLFNWAKGSSGLEGRIQCFVKNCEEFNRKRQPHEIVFDSPRRSKTVMF
ncbi:uncharacterized protein LOC110460678 [Mizuhopecten yessoensis]|uniref:Uncharacterized protein n=1 Tax=Mizuhopecten yessoensis TaxID=6573 RepID=A0A210Q1Y3_MIZYE|nr:uncharacterized protein LOC110460678 [Mizuhopecten yessoensis]XP_021369397.1 uncharacterized protein LOC110460678 [Mizuhopecten yessoensis]XP_021369398.1 uncharacterized protein LOC110460678 [Mizuhopecten yessoensis]XP_021369400.1 uncharacterized protein LOC110460678 [Mizuhopecten yessoensis]OWF42768.1 hypothetical protein KP79_PYT07202 [Mizuhopecten yessoensis]